MRLATVRQCRQIDQLTQDKFEVGAEVLMEAAGVAAAREIELSFFPELRNGGCSIICGPGHNGADALVVARILQSTSIRSLRVYAPEKGAALFERQRARVKKFSLPVHSLEEFCESGEPSSLIVDGLFGTGLNRPLGDLYARVVAKMNSISAPVVSLDAPSGLNSDEGTVEGTCVSARMTLTFGFPKPGFFINRGPQSCGRLRVLNIGFPKQVRRQVASTHFGITEKLVRRSLPKREPESNKSHHGRVLVLAGGPSTYGAGLLSALSAFRTGAGYVTWVADGQPYKEIQKAPEILTGSLDSSIEINNFDSVAVGPGLGIGESLAQLIRKLPDQNVVVDADGIRTACSHQLFPFPATWVITPHAGEMSQIIERPASWIEENRFSATKMAAEKTGCIVLLKGFRTVISDGKRFGVVMSGNASLATAGTGDVLTGMIAGFMAQGLNSLRAASLAAFLHGKIADDWVRSGRDTSALVAHDLIDLLPRTLASLRSGLL